MISHFDVVSGIDPDDDRTWARRVFLTFDMDWAHDDVVNDSIDLVEQAGISATWFVTHDTPVLQRLRSLGGQELAVHPNFNDLLSGANRTGEGGAEGLLERIRRVVPEARSVRSHSLVQSERLVDVFERHGLTHISNCFIPHRAGFPNRPFRLWGNAVVVPHCFQDNVALKMPTAAPSPEDLSTGFHVFDFHPIHVFLNTEDLTRYERTRHLHHKPVELARHRYEGRGTRTRLIDLLSLARPARVEASDPQ